MGERYYMALLAWLRPSPRGDEVEPPLPSPPASVNSFSGPDSKGSEPEQINLTLWLEGIKPGYADRFLPAFLAIGVEDVLDLSHIDQVFNLISPLPARAAAGIRGQER